MGFCESGFGEVEFGLEDEGFVEVGDEGFGTGDFGDRGEVAEDGVVSDLFDEVFFLFLLLRAPGVFEFFVP